MRKCLIPYLFLPLLFLISCHNDDDEFGSDNPYLPMAVGNYWEFSDVNMLPAPALEHREVTGRLSVNSHEYFVVVSTRSSGNDIFIDTLLYRVTFEGFVYRYRKNDTDESQIFRLNARKGESWTYTYQHETTRVSVTESSIDLLLGTLANCKDYYIDTIQSADEEHTISLAPGVGFVKDFSNAWGQGQVLRKARINGVVKAF